MLKLEMRTSEVVEVAQFDLEEGEKLSDRVKSEIEKAISEGRAPGTVMRMSVPPVRVRDAAEGQNSSMALFDYSGREVSDRVHEVEVDHGDAGSTYLLTVKESDDENAEIIVIGSFADEGLAHRVGALWRAGLLD